MTAASPPPPLHQQAKRPVNALVAGRYGHPYHPVLVTVPIGAWVAALVFDVASRLADDGEAFARGAMWLVGIGVVGALAAAAVGLLDLLAIPSGTRARRIALVHMTLNLLVTASYAAAFLWRQAGDGPDGPVGTAQVVHNAVTLAVLGVSGYLGGELAYRYGVRVADEATQQKGFATGSAGPPPAPQRPESSPASR